VYFASEQLPTLAAWEQAAGELGIRLRIMPVDLRTHAGMLPVAFEDDDWNSGFEFQLRPDWGRAEESAEFLRDKDMFAWFRCFRSEWPAAAWAAVAFAKASGGVFHNPLGKDFATLDQAIAYARAESQPESDAEQAERAAEIKARREHVEAVLREGEKVHRQHIEEGKTCPKCGFSYSWTGRECNHCRFRVAVGEGR
jgi:hypothetical protein